METLLPPCPHLPPAPVAMHAGALTALGSERGPEFYLTALTYGHYLWQRGLAARAVLCLDRALGADLCGTEPVLRDWPLPYAAMRWFIARTPPEIFIGNPRVHFQHLADRMNEPRRDQRRWRAWACWALARTARPEWPADPKHRVVEPSLTEIAARLEAYGIPGERELWQRVLHDER
jgi:hypothetical protein